MQTRLADFIRDRDEGREADAILRKCVHCGFCTATCPTYQLLGDELDGPRGRIYLIKQALEGGPVGSSTRRHLDRCLTCRSCETTCPSGVRYGRLVDIGRAVVDERVPRPWRERAARRALVALFGHRKRLSPLLALGRALRPVLPRALRRRVPPPRPPRAWPPRRHAKTMLCLEGCVQSALAPGIDAAAARVLDRQGISLLRAPGAGCCGALAYHLGARESGLRRMRANIDAWWPGIEAGARAVLATSSACADMIKDYGERLAGEPAYAAKAARVSAMARDASEVVAAAGARGTRRGRIVFHSPCTLQHGQQIRGRVEALLEAAGFELAPVAGAHLCCGSAGTYSILQRGLSARLLADKVAALQASDPVLIATANIGCLVHLESAAERPVLHWLELLDDVQGAPQRRASGSEDPSGAGCTPA